jgi:hypothetical protein
VAYKTGRGDPVRRPARGRRARRPASRARILCVIDEFQVLLAGNDPMATEAVRCCESLARKGRSYGIHLILASQTVLGVEALYAKRDSIFGPVPGADRAARAAATCWSPPTTRRPACRWAPRW